jgi:uncharacterized protein (DUF983 family)
VAGSGTETEGCVNRVTPSMVKPPVAWSEVNAALTLKVSNPMQPVKSIVIGVSYHAKLSRFEAV